MNDDTASRAWTPTSAPGTCGSLTWEPPPHSRYNESEAIRAAIAEQGVLPIGSWPNRVTLGQAMAVPPASRKRVCDTAFGAQRLDELSSLDEVPLGAAGGKGGELPSQSGLEDASGLQEVILEAQLMAFELSLSASVLEPLVQALGGGDFTPQQGPARGTGSGDYSFEALMFDAAALDTPSPDGGRLTYAGA